MPVVIKNRTQEDELLNNEKEGVSWIKWLKRIIPFPLFMLMWTDVAFANQLTSEESAVMSDIDGLLFKIQLICAGVSVSVAVLMAMVAGFFRMIGLREEAKKRYTDAIAGMIMVITAPVVLGVIATIIRGLMKVAPALS